MSTIEDIANIHETFERWREMGSRKMRSGTEFIGLVPDPDGEMWMHALYAGLPPADIDALEAQLGRPLPRDLRVLYSVTRGMSLFQGAFRIFGKRSTAFTADDSAAQPDDILQLDHEIEVLGWKPAGAVPFAVNGWDQSVHLFGMTTDPRAIVRCDRSNGQILETHHTIWEMLMTRLYKLDELLVQE